jgi:hypothetical protein
MAASAWTVFNQAKHNLGLGKIDLSGDAFRIMLFRTSASANLLTNITTIGTDAKESLGSIVWTGTASANAGTRKWDVADPVFTASGGAISNVRYAVIYTSTASADRLLCYAALSTVQFPVTVSNTLTVQMASTGVFTLA